MKNLPTGICREDAEAQQRIEGLAARLVLTRGERRDRAAEGKAVTCCCFADLGEHKCSL